MSGIEEMLGATLTSVDVIGNEVIAFTLEDGREYRMRHEQDCCESVWVEDICGDVADLIGTPLLASDERTKDGKSDYGSMTWTFYVLSTLKGTVTIRWCGESNGYYSEDVDVIQTKGAR